MYYLIVFFQLWLSLCLYETEAIPICRYIVYEYICKIFLNDTQITIFMLHGLPSNYSYALAMDVGLLLLIALVRCTKAMKITK